MCIHGLWVVVEAMNEKNYNTLPWKSESERAILLCQAPFPSWSGSAFLHQQNNANMKGGPIMGVHLPMTHPQVKPRHPILSHEELGAVITLLPPEQKPSGFSNRRFSVCFFVWKTLPREAWKTGRLPHTGKRSKQEKKQPTTVASTAPSQHWGTEEHDAALSWRFQDLCMALCYVNNNMAT